jgi:hypothetical protein
MAGPGHHARTQFVPPYFETRFKELLNENTIREIANFQSQLHLERQSIRERIEKINASLHEIAVCLRGGLRAQRRGQPVDAAQPDDRGIPGGEGGAGRVMGHASTSKNERWTARSLRRASRLQPRELPFMTVCGRRRPPRRAGAAACARPTT